MSNRQGRPTHRAGLHPTPALPKRQCIFVIHVAPDDMVWFPAFSFLVGIAGR